MMRGTRKDYDQPTREQVEALVKAFLDSPQRESDGGFAEVPDGDKNELDALILALVKYRYEPDPDGDRPIRWLLCDWTREEPNRYLLMPQDEGSKMVQARLLIAQINVAYASEALRIVAEEVREALEERKAKPD